MQNYIKYTYKVNCALFIMWFLVSGFWLLAAGCWLLARG